ncbi:CAP domain-containing protein [Streptomyces sp. NPDC005791]|jgi:uncharacterized protein YkwD|uniref:CAP domain-containing protein n=1 Tax=Streptomyces sp. NPDC005791 TaxID=3364732 RepID=UPI0036796DBB
MGNHTARTKFAALAAAVVCSAPLVLIATPAAAAQPECGDASTTSAIDRAPSEGSHGDDPFSRALICLINDERAKRGLPTLSQDPALTAAATLHARQATSQQWWGPGNNPHNNPTTGSTPESRIKGAGYCPNPRSWAFSEITYTGWGGGGTPRAAVNWWMNISKAGHREAILNASMTALGTGVQGGAAAPAGRGFTDAGTYVVTFGRCQR